MPVPGMSSYTHSGHTSVIVNPRVLVAQIVCDRRGKMGSIRMPDPQAGITEALLGKQRRDFFQALGMSFPCFIGLQRRRHCWDKNVPNAGRKSLPRGPLWSGRPMSKEGIAVVQALKGSKDSPEALSRVLATQVSRLLKLDLLEVLKDLERQNECMLALKIFDVVRAEDWYKPDLGLYRRLFLLMWRNGLVEEMANLFEQLKQEGLEPELLLYRELMLAYLKTERPLQAMKTFEEAKHLGMQFSEQAYKTLINGLNQSEQHELADAVQLELTKVFPER